MKAENIEEAAEILGCVVHFADLIAHLDSGDVETITIGSEGEIDAGSPPLVAAIRVVLVQRLDERVRELKDLGAQVSDRDGLIKAAVERRERQRI